ncbi:MAG: protein-L-isoaspartate(D-aspartate) O-methyltransferase [Planctomycetales bacterium]|nr:protein-L-isoaspartate(D-aspartate) O-methyltransferase [Planctomycetales bacterium]
MSKLSPSDQGTVDYAAWRELMVQNQLESRGILDPEVLEAMRRVPREQFVPVEERDAAYEDRPLPIGFGQTISQPFTVAYTIEALQLRGVERVLDVGTGSGYAAAVLSLLAKEVHSVERIPELAEQARTRLKTLGYNNVEVHVGDGTLGLPERAPFDAILVSAGAAQLPTPYFEQLSDQGRIVIPVGEVESSQDLLRFTRHGDELREANLGLFAFVPLIGEYGWRG